MNGIADRLAALDISLFDQIQGQTTDDDRTSLLSVQLALGNLRPNYSYLEIGSYLGGSIQPHLLDDKCQRIVSVDKRPLVQPDARGYDWVYQNNSTARMLEGLKQVSPDISKIETIDGDTSEIKPEQVGEKVDACFIDGEHTDEAAFRDFRFCLDVLADNGLIMFHDSQITYNAIADATQYLTDKGIAFKAYPLPLTAFVIEIGDFPLHKEPAVAAQMVKGHLSYIACLRYNDNYRRFATRFPFGAIRRTLIRFRRSNVSN
ncbi:MAG TPA: class I SAM-dependent methyltransferase [Pyrinomonadaceae bacterium]|nr:class I SAM-dependent methyltransferase [Pyrinomonadaceae bacterium]